MAPAIFRKPHIPVYDAALGQVVNHIPKGKIGPLFDTDFSSKSTNMVRGRCTERFQGPAIFVPPGFATHEERVDDPQVLKQRMCDFIRRDGNIAVPFEDFMRESLYGTQGYYGRRIEIGEGKDFETAALLAEFAEMMALWLRDEGLDRGQLLEIGGGNGTFKRNLLRELPGLDFISVDASLRLALLQAQVDDRARVGSAMRLPVGTGEINGVIFANELLDAFPCRTYQLGPDCRYVSRELHVYNLFAPNLYYDFGPPERDEFLAIYNAYLRSRERPFRKGMINSVSPQLIPALREMYRVLVFWFSRLTCPAKARATAGAFRLILKLGLRPSSFG